MLVFGTIGRVINTSITTIMQLVVIVFDSVGDYHRPLGLSCVCCCGSWTR